MKARLAKPLETTHWLNTPSPITLNALRGKVVLLEAFQMLCPGCVSYSLPQAMRARALFSEEDVSVIGLHTVFEHHGAQGTKDALEAFLHEYRITFPVGIDAPSANGGPPKTMTAYGMQGTPTTILIDRGGNIRKQRFGRDEDMLLGAEIMSLLREDASPVLKTDETLAKAGCTDEGCPI
ncbi:MAG: TlpA disulfide reductase family protein [Pseudomonadota bacterium]